MELTKCVLCVLCLIGEGLFQKDRFENLRQIRRSWTLTNSLLCGAVPAVLYSLQNVLTQSGFRYLDALTYNLLNQCKILFTAVCLFFLMGKKQSLVQLLALLMLGTAAFLLNRNQAVPEDADELAREEWLQKGFFPVLAATVISGINTAFTQMVLTEKRNSYLFSMELAIIGIGVLLAKMFSTEEGQKILSTGEYERLTEGMDGWIMVPVGLQAAGGIIVGLVVKYAGGVRKGFGLVIGILLTAVLQSVLEGTPVTGVQCFAAVLVTTSLYLHANYPPQKETDKTKQKAS
mmetsp:Transcript_7242/g.27639  ORF Transcript_7242/g.27639 Transcript_7242/m.27639 type:complete len:290 (-) Transcript_7242:55-924(-)